MTQRMHVLNSRVVGVLVGNKERGLDVASIGILALPVEDLIVQINVVVVDGIVKGNHDHLRNIGTVRPCWSHVTELAWDLRAIFRTEAIWQLADGGVTRWGAVGISVNI